MDLIGNTENLSTINHKNQSSVNPRMSESYCENSSSIQADG